MTNASTVSGPTWNDSGMAIQLNMNYVYHNNYHKANKCTNLKFSSIDLETDVIGFQLPIPTYLVKPYGCVSF